MTNNAMKGEDMANSLRAKLSKLRHDGHITDAEYQAFIKKMEGHDREIRAKAIDEFAERLKQKNYDGKLSCFGWHEFIDKEIDEIAEQMKGNKKIFNIQKSFFNTY